MYYRTCSPRYGPNHWWVNNAFSTDKFSEIDSGCNVAAHADFNWIGGNIGSGLWTPTKSNIIATNQFLWPKVDGNTTWDPVGTARASGLNLAQNWTVDGVTHPPLPGMSTGYFLGVAPNRGMVQDVGPLKPPAHLRVVER
jgi:hypothetical protein